MKISQLKKLNSSGITHIAIPVLAIAIVAVGGTFLMVSSHANSAPKKKATSSTVVKKKKATLVVVSRDATPHSFDIAANLRYNGTSVTQESCGGDLNYTFTDKSGRVYTGTKLLPEWTGNTCTYYISKAAIPVTLGNAKLRLDYRGTSIYKSYKSSTTVKVKNPPKDGGCFGALC